MKTWEDVENKLAELADEELRYLTDYITNEGRKIIEEKVPAKALATLKEEWGDDEESMEEMWENGFIEDAFNDALSELKPENGYRDYEGEMER